MFSRKCLLGLDINPSGLRLLEAKRREKYITIMKQGFCPLPANSIKEGILLNLDNFVIALKTACQSGKIGHNKVVFAAPPQTIFTKSLELPKMEYTETKETLKWDIKKYVPLEGNIIFDLQIVSATQDKNTVLLIAAEEKSLTPYCEAIEKAGLIPAAIDILPLAVARVIKCSELKAELQNTWNTGIVLNIDIGDELTHLNFFYQGQLQLYRIFSFEGRNTDYSPLLNEITRCVRFYQIEHRNHEIGGIILTGGPSISSIELAAFLETEIGIPSEVIQPVLNVADYDHSLTRALGLALRGTVV